MDMGAKEAKKAVGGPPIDPPAELVSRARQAPGLAEALTAFDAIRPFLPQLVPQVPQVTFSTHTNV